MIKRFSIHLVVQFGVLIVVSVMAFCPAILFMGGISVTAIWIAPEFTFGLMDEMVCPEGRLDYYWSYHEPNTYDAHIECVSEDGVGEDALFAAILCVLGLAFLTIFIGFFLPVFLVLSITTLILTCEIIPGREGGRNGL